MVYKMLFQRSDLPMEERIKDLISRLTLEEKVSQLLYDSAAIPHLGIPEYNWWNECLHGVARAGTATVFPQAIGMAASFNAPLLQQVAEVIATEARAKHHEAARHGDRGIYKGLTFWTPNINIFRDPRWGRGQETYGEDPYLTAQLGIAFVKGLQGDHPKYLKAAACAKHFAVHSGPESLRHSFDARCSQKDLYETYLPAFRALVTEAKVESVMGAYNRTNGEPCCASPTLLQNPQGRLGLRGPCGLRLRSYPRHPRPPQGDRQPRRVGCPGREKRLRPQLRTGVPGSGGSGGPGTHLRGGD